MLEMGMMKHGSKTYWVNSELDPVGSAQLALTGKFQTHTQIAITFYENDGVRRVLLSNNNKL